MDQYIVCNREGLAAALFAAARPTNEAARDNPFEVSLGGTKFKVTAKFGMTERRALVLAKRLKRLPAKFFVSPPFSQPQEETTA